MLEVSGITQLFGGVTALDNVTFSITKGDITGVIGPNGAGKTTLLRLVMGFVKARAGRVTFDEANLDDVAPQMRTRLGIGYAPEDRAMFPTFSVEENLRFPCEVMRMARGEVARRLEEVLVIVPELKPMLGRSGSALSGGQGKMAALGRALMAGTRLVMLDEPFQGLAPVLATQYSESLRRLRSVRPDLCLLITESNRSLLRDIPDLTLTLERGALSSDAAEA